MNSKEEIAEFEKRLGKVAEEFGIRIDIEKENLMSYTQVSKANEIKSISRATRVAIIQMAIAFACTAALILIVRYAINNLLIIGD